MAYAAAMIAARQIRIALLVLAALVAGALLYGTYRYSYQQVVGELHDRAKSRLKIVVANLKGELDKYSFQPKLLAREAYVIDALAGPRSRDVIDRANTALAQVNGVTGALATYLMDRSGNTLASSNWALETSFVGKNFSFRPYFQQAMQGRLGSFFALGTTSGERGYYFSYPVRVAGEIEGVVVVKMDVAPLEQTWQSEADEFVALDENGIVFLSTEPSWLFKAFRPLDKATRRQLEAGRQYAGRHLQNLDVRHVAGQPLVRLPGSSLGEAEDDRVATRPKAFVLASKKISAGWEVVVLANAAEIGGHVRLAMLVVGFMFFSAVLLVANIMQRRRRLTERIAMQEQARAQLEETVADRTRDLSDAVERLRDEVAERQRTEDNLCKTQEELIQASKLAALGSLSAGLSHELNQPLTAIRNYSENAKVFLDRGNSDMAFSNLGRIAEMSDRMARIIRNLRTFARNETVGVRPTRLLFAIRNALALLEAEIEKAGVAVDVGPVDEDVAVKGGEVRLQQVFVNLISNALDAMADVPDKRLHISVDTDGQYVEISLRDSGPGVDPSVIDRVFDPFVTTKDVGKGTGLGLSITFGIIKQFGGTISVQNGDAGGAEFKVRLVRVERHQEAAE